MTMKVPPFKRPEVPPENVPVIKELRQLLALLESGKTLPGVYKTDKLLVKHLAVHVMDATGAGSFVRNLVMGFFK